MVCLHVCLLPLDCAFLGGSDDLFVAGTERSAMSVLGDISGLHDQAGPQRETGISTEGGQRPPAQGLRGLSQRWRKAGVGDGGEGRAARPAAQICPCSTVAPPSGDAQHNLGKNPKPPGSPEQRRDWKLLPLEGAPGKLPVPKAKRTGLTASCTTTGTPSLADFLIESWPDQLFCQAPQLSRKHCS